MVIAFYVDEMNLRGVSNSTFKYALYNQKLLKNKSIIFYNKKNSSNKKEVINKFKKKFITKGVNNFKKIDDFKSKFNIEFIYTQKGGEKNHWVSDKIKTFVHAVYPQKLREIHGYHYVSVSDWLNKKFSNDKLPVLPYIVEVHKTKSNLKSFLKIKKKQKVFGCHGGESSFDLKFTHDVLQKIVKDRKDFTFLFLNINKFCDHPRIKFIKGTTCERFKKKFLNTCDVMIYGRSLGESFGLACGEFAFLNKPIISYKFNRHTNHKFSLSNENFFEYGSFKELYSILNKFNFKKLNYRKNSYLKYDAKKVMKIFHDIIQSNHNEIDLSFVDYLTNIKNFYFMHYKYIRHKLYHHYYNFIESKFIKIHR